MNPAPFAFSTRCLFCALSLAAVLAANRTSLAADANGFPVCTAPSDHTTPVIVADGAGGAIIVWHDNRPTATGVCFAQRVNAQGVPLWAADGVQLCTSADPNPPAIASDGAGGAFVALGGDGSAIRAQWVNASGVVQWGVDGAQLSVAVSARRDLAITRDIGGAGGAIVAWRELSGAGGNSDIYAQKISSGGTTQWGGFAAPVVMTSMNNETLPALVSDGAGGAIVMWLGNGARAQRLNAAGATQWGNTILSAGTNNRVPTIASDGSGGAVMAWATGGGASAQKLDSAGNKLWGNGAVLLSTGGNQVTMIPDGSGGGIFVWQDFRSGTNFNIYAQKVNGVGTAQWIPNGVEVCTATQDQVAPTIISDGGTGAIIAWYDYRSGMTGPDIYAQRIDANGASQWTLDGVPLCAAADLQELPTIASDAAGGAFVTWQDRRSGTNEDIYADRVGPNGVLLAVPPGGRGSSTARAWPDPFADHVQIAFELPATTAVRFEVFGVDGRRVRSFGTRALGAGAHVLAWDGRVDNGRPAQGGIYFLRVSGPGMALSTPVVRLR